MHDAQKTQWFEGKKLLILSKGVNQRPCDTGNYKINECCIVTIWYLIIKNQKPDAWSLLCTVLVTLAPSMRLKRFEIQIDVLTTDCLHYYYPSWLMKILTLNLMDSATCSSLKGLISASYLLETFDFVIENVTVTSIAKGEGAVSVGCLVLLFHLVKKLSKK